MMCCMRPLSLSGVIMLLCQDMKKQHRGEDSTDCCLTVFGNKVEFEQAVILEAKDTFEARVHSVPA